MVVPLDQWQERMERHFKALAKSRAGSGLPLFALEHGLNSAETEEIASQLRARLSSGARLAPHWLLWTIYAAERGYTYDGAEYWQSFEETTPGWDGRERYRVSAWFSRFQKTYNGFTPSGPWATHFSIIAWPITHAVLPRYLQRQFTQTLYVLRFQLARLTTLEPAVIGRLLAANAFDASSRFEQFLQQEELVGRMVLALLHKQVDSKSEEPLLPATLQRIVKDLEAIRHARGWITETGRVVSDRFKGLGKEALSRSLGGRPERATSTVHRIGLDIRPDLRLHHKGQGAWDLQIDIPSFKDVAAQNAEVRQFLKQTRCVLNGSPVKKPAGWLLSGRRQAVLRKWPDPERPLIDFEKYNGTVRHLLESECLISKGPYWLFRVRRDGIAREIRGRIVRPGNDYIIASKSPVEDLLERMEPCTINCSDMSAIQIGVPREPSDDYAEWLKQKDLEIARTIRVWPAGFPGRHWDGEGRSEWLTTERPCFGIVPDHIVDTYQITLDDKESRTVEAGSPGVPTFVQLSELPVGRHFLTIRAQRPEAAGDRPQPYKGFLELRVRDPEPWIPGTASHSGLVVSASPHDAALHTFWNNEYELSVFGPPSRRITPHVVLQSAWEEETFSHQVCCALELPLTPDVWAKRFSDFLKREQCEWRYLEASSGLLILDGGDLGRYVIRFEHEVRPLRWVLRQRGEGVSVRLVDETGQEDVELSCDYFSMKRPNVAQRLDVNEVLEGMSVTSPGGLFVAKGGEYQDAVIVSTGLTSAGLDGLGVQPDHGRISGAPKSIAMLLFVLNMWHKNRVSGPLAGVRRRQVTDALMHGVVGILAGWNWARAEAELNGADDPHGPLERLQSLMSRSDDFASEVRRSAPSIHGGQRTLKSWYAETSRRFRICLDQSMSHFAIDFACRPNALPSLYSDELSSFLQRAQSEQNLLRGARLAVFSRMAAAEQPLTLIPEPSA